MGAKWRKYIDLETIHPAILHMLFGFTYGGIVSFLMIYGNERAIEHTSTFFLISSLSSFAVRTISGKLEERLGCRWILIPSAISSMIGLICLSLTTNMPLLLLSALLYGIGFGGIQPSLQTWMVSRVAPRRWGAANSTYNSGFDLGTIMGTIVLGSLIIYVSYSTIYLLSGLVFLIFLLPGKMSRKNPLARLIIILF